MVLLLAVAWGAELALAPSPGATVELLPSVSSGRADILVHGNHADLRAQVRVGGEGVRSARALDLGGDWVVTVWLHDPTQAVVLLPSGLATPDVWRVVSQPAPPVTPPVDLPVPTLAELRTGTAAAHGCPARPLPLTPLSGREATWGFGAADFTPLLPVWSEAEPPTVSWEAVAATRQAVARTRGAAERAPLLYQLGALHRALGHAREAAYYFGKADTAAGDSGGDDRGLAALQQAGALLRVRQWAAAVDAAWRAERAGAPEEAVLEVLGVVALATPTGGGSTEAAPTGAALPPLAVGRALALASPRAEVQLLAGTLLSRDGCTAEAIPLLRAAEPHLAGEAQQVARLLLTDAYLLAGEPLEADSALSRIRIAGLREPWRGMTRVRGRLLPMLLQTADQWLAALPTLQREALAYTPEGAESLWVLGQVYERLGEERAAIDAYSTLLDRHRALARGEAGQRLLAMWALRTRQLLDADRPFDALALHARVWRPGLTAIVDDPTLLRRLAHAYREASLPTRALAVLQDIVNIEGRTGQDTRASAVEVAALYLALDRPEEALDAVAWLRQGRPSGETAVAATSVEAQALERLGRPAEARESWSRLLTDPTWGLRARAHLVLLDARSTDCATSVGPLAALVAAFAPGEGAPDAGEVPEQLAVSAALDRCLVALGRAPTDGTAARSEAAATLAPSATVATEDATQAAFLARLGKRSARR